MATGAIMPRKLLRSTSLFYRHYIAARATLDNSALDEVTQKSETTPVSEDIIKLMPRPPKQDTELLEAALIGFQHKGHPASGPAATAASGASASKKRTMSAAARRRIALAQKKRWAAYKAEHGTKAVAAPKAKKRIISAAGRARIVAATKKRWAAYRKAQEAQAAG
jgi:hypothetical protein